MELSEAAQFFIGYCFEGSEVRHLTPLFNEKYHRAAGEKLFKFSEEVLQEMSESGTVTIKFQDSKTCNIAGVVGMSPHNETNLSIEKENGNV